MPLTLTIDSYYMSELIRVSNLTKFQGLSTGSRKAVDNPPHMGASSLDIPGSGIY
jgi:hypothetical protein